MTRTVLLRRRAEHPRGSALRAAAAGALLLALSTALLLTVPAQAEVIAVRSGASGVSVTGALTLVAPRPTVVLQADQSTPADQLGPVSGEDLNLAVAGILNVARLTVEAQAFREAAGLRATASSLVGGLRIPSGGAPLFGADALRSTCTASAGGTAGTVEILRTGQSAPTAVSPNTQVAVAGLLSVVLNEQVPTETAGVAALTVRGAHIRLLQTNPNGQAVVDIVLAETRCEIRSGSPTATTGSPNGANPTVPTTATTPPSGPGPTNRGTGSPTTTASRSGTATTAVPTTAAPSLAAGGGPLQQGTGSREARELGSATAAGDTRRSTFVESVIPASEISLSPAVIAENALIAMGLILLVAFPAELFNATVLQNYDEISQWPLVAGVTRAGQRFAGVPDSVGIPIFAVIAALVYAQLSPDFGFNRGSLALLVGLLLTLLAVSLCYDVSRTRFVRRFEIPAQLRTHAVVLPFAVLLVIVSRVADFTPGYVYGLFTAVVYLRPIGMELDGRGLARAAALLGVLSAGAWILWEPVQNAAREPGAGALILILDAFLASFWVTGLGAIVFGLLPMRFMDGDAVKQWNGKIWALIYGAGVLIFLHTIAHPDRGFYGRGDVPLPLVLIPFLLFGLFSLGFWAYFRFRRQPPSAVTPVAGSGAPVGAWPPASR